MGDLVMNETLRLFTPTPAIGRKLEQDTKLGEIICPAGTEVMMPMCAVHRDPTYWDRPDDFIPERFQQHFRHFTYESVPGHRFKTFFNGFGSMVYCDKAN